MEMRFTRASWGSAAVAPASCYACESALSCGRVDAQADLCTQIASRSASKTG